MSRGSQDWMKNALPADTKWIKHGMTQTDLEEAIRGIVREELMGTEKVVYTHEVVLKSDLVIADGKIVKNRAGHVGWEVPVADGCYVRIDRKWYSDGKGYKSGDRLREGTKGYVQGTSRRKWWRLPRIKLGWPAAW